MVEQQSSFFPQRNGSESSTTSSTSTTGRWRLPQEENGRGVWFSVEDAKGSRLAVKMMVSESEVVMVDFTDGARVVGAAPIDEISTVTVHEIFGGKKYDAKLEVTTRAATLVLWRDALSSAREAQEADAGAASSRGADEAAVAAFLVAVGCQPQPRPRNSSRLGLGSRVATYTTITSFPEDDDQAAAVAPQDPLLASATTLTAATAIPAAVAEEKMTVGRRRAASGDEDRSTTKQGTEITGSEEEEDEAFERLWLRGERRWGGKQQDLPPSLRRKPAVLEADDDSSSSSSSRPSSFKTNKQLAYRGSWLAPVDDAPPVSFSKPLTKSPTPSPRHATSAATAPKRRPFRSISSTDSLVEVPPEKKSEPDQRRERYRDALATATTSAAQKAADVSRAALSVHADAERLGAQLSTDVSTSELESNLSLAADGAKEARARLAALEREVAMLAGPTLRELEWATQLRRTADARLAKHLASEWPRKGWVKFKCLPGSSTPPEKYWTERLFLELVDNNDNSDAERGGPSSASSTPPKLVAKTANSVVVLELELTAEVELRRCRERGAPAFALEVVPKAKHSTDEDGRSASWYSAVASYFFDTFSSESVKDKDQHFAFAPDSADEQRCWSLTIDDVLREAAIAKAVAAGDTHEEAPDAPVPAEPVRTDLFEDSVFLDAISPEDDDQEFADVAASIVVPEAAAPPAFADSSGEGEHVVPPVPISKNLEAPTPYDGDDDKDTRPSQQPETDDDDDDEFASVQSSLEPETPPPPVEPTKMSGLSKLEAFKLSMAATSTASTAPNRQRENEGDDDESDRRSAGEKMAVAKREVGSRSSPSSELAPKPVSSQQQQQQEPTVSQLNLLERESDAHVEASSIFESQSLEAIIHESAPPVAPTSQAAASMSSSSRAKFRVSASQRERLSKWRDKLASDVNAAPSTRVSRSLSSSSRSSRGRSLPPAKVQKSSRSSRTGTKDDAYMIAPSPAPAPAPSSVAELRRAYRERTPERPSPKSKTSSAVESRRSSRASSAEKPSPGQTTPSVAELSRTYSEQAVEKPPSQSQAPPAVESDQVSEEATGQKPLSPTAPSVAELRRAYREQAAGKPSPLPKATSATTAESRSAHGEPTTEKTSTEERTPKKPSPEQTGPSVAELRRAYREQTVDKASPQPKASSAIETRTVSATEKSSTQQAATSVVEQPPTSNDQLVEKPSAEQTAPSVAELRRAYREQTVEKTSPAKPKASSAVEPRRSTPLEKPSPQHGASPVVEKRPPSTDELVKKPSPQSVASSVVEARTFSGDLTSEKPMSEATTAVEQIRTSSTDQPIEKASAGEASESRRVSEEPATTKASQEKTASTAVEPRRVSTAKASPEKAVSSVVAARRASRDPTPVAKPQEDQKASSVAELRRAYREQNAPKPSQSPPTSRSTKRMSAARRLSQNQKRTGGVSSMIVTKRQRNGEPSPAKLTTDSNKASASDMIRELERGAIVTLRFLPRTETQCERYEYECIDAFDFIDDETLAPLLQSHKRPTLARLYSAWRSEFSVKTDQNEFRGRLKELMASQARRWLASCSLLEVERPDETCVVVVRLHDDPNEYVQPIKFGDVVICWSPKRDDGSMTFADRATATPVVVANLSTWLDNHRVTAQRTLRIETANANQDVHSPLNYDYVYRKLFQKAVVK